MHTMHVDVICSIVDTHYLVFKVIYYFYLYMMLYHHLYKDLHLHYYLVMLEFIRIKIFNKMKSLVLFNIPHWRPTEKCIYFNRLGLDANSNQNWFWSAVIIVDTEQKSYQN